MNKHFIQKLGIISIATILSACSFFQGQPSQTSLKIGDSSEITSLSPFQSDQFALSRLKNIYEGLIAFDAHMQPKPALAIAWGNPDNLTWEFELRETQFADGSNVTPEDILQAFTLQKENNPALNDFFANLAEIGTNPENPHKIYLRTIDPDPTLLRQLTKIFIFKGETGQEIGTGPFQMKSFEPGEKLVLESNPNWWGKNKIWQEVEFQAIPEKRDRSRLLENGTLDLLLAVPPDIYKDDKINKNLQIKTLPKLAVTFLGFNLAPQINETENKLAQLTTRQALRLALDREQIMNKLQVGTLAQISSQFVGVNVFGFTPEIHLPKIDLEGAKKLLQNEQFFLDLDFTPEMKSLAENIQFQLAQVGLVTRLHSLSAANLLTKIQTRKSQMFLTGWLAESGDAGDFFSQTIRSDSPYNIFHITDSDLDWEIERQATLLDASERLPILQNLMQAVVENQIVGIPLFEEERIYALQKPLDFTPRQDEAIFIPEIGWQEN